MVLLSRRSFVALAGAVPFSLWFAKYALGNSSTQVLTRYDALSPQGQAMLAKYAMAVDKMANSTGEGDPTSWVFQWYTHWVKGSTSRGSEIARIYSDPSDPHRALAEEMWQTCQAHGPGGNESAFLPWHRMFVNFLEQIVRNISGDPSFTLPYWDYSNSDPSVHAVLPS